MPGILDIGDLSETIALSPKVMLNVFGLTAEDIFYLIANFPEIKALLERKVVSITPKKLMESAPKTLATLIACGSRERGKEGAPTKAEVSAAIKLPAGAQLKILGAIFRLTFPEGAGPFVRELESIQRSFSGPTEDLDTASPARLSAALQMDALSAKRYRPHRVN